MKVIKSPFFMTYSLQFSKVTLVAGFTSRSFALGFSVDCWSAVLNLGVVYFGIEW